MKASKIFIALLLALPAIGLQSCLKDQEDVFDKSYSERMAEFLQQAQEILLTDLPSIPLWYPNTNGGWSANVDNVSFDWHGQAVYQDITKK